MSGTSSNTSFFSFGPDESYISKSLEGLRYRNLPPTLHQLIAQGSVIDVHWAALGPSKESWVLSFKDAQGKHNLGWGAETPQDLQDILKGLTPSPLFCIFLGPRNSFIAWDPSFIRWLGLPSGLEACLQTWLTPSGWKAGPPRLVTWGPRGAWLAVSEYGEAKWRLGSGDAWMIFKETAEEWDEEVGFQWSDLAYISLDPTTPDQFVAIRQDGTWAGSIDDSSEDALESFALNFFSRAKAKQKAKANGYQDANGVPQPADMVPDAAAQALYKTWAADAADSFAMAQAALGNRTKAPKKLEIRSKSSPASMPTTSNSPSTTGKLLSQFPYLPPELATCALPLCISAKADPEGLRACKHDVWRLFRASGRYSYEWLRQERIQWHPDKFGRFCEEGFREKGRKLAEEMFKIIDSLMSDLEAAGATNGA